MNFLGRGFQNLEIIDRQTDRTENTTTVYSEVVIMHKDNILTKFTYLHQQT